MSAKWTDHRKDRGRAKRDAKHTIEEVSNRFVFDLLMFFSAQFRDYRTPKTRRPTPAVKFTKRLDLFGRGDETDDNDRYHAQAEE